MTYRADPYPCAILRKTPNGVPDAVTGIFPTYPEACQYLQTHEIGRASCRERV